MISTATTKDVRIVRWMDGHRIVSTFTGLSSGEVLALRYEHQCYPGTVAEFRITDTPRRWESHDAR